MIAAPAGGTIVALSPTERTSPMASVPRFAARWLLASLAGLILGAVALVVTMTAITAAGGSEESDVLFAIPLGLIIGGSLGLAQQAVLRRRVPGVPWALASTAGMLAGTLLVFNVIGDDGGVSEPVEAVLHALAVGLSMGIAQGLALRHRVSRGDRWLPIAVAVWLTAEGLGRSVIALTGAEEAGLLTIFLSAHALTGPALGMLLAGTRRQTAAAAAA